MRHALSVRAMAVLFGLGLASSVAAQTSRRPSRRRVDPPDPGASERAATAAGLPAGDVAEVTGAWEGIAHVYPQIVRLRLELRDAGGGDIEGEVRQGPLEKGARPGQFPNAEIVYAVRGHYDVAGGLVLTAVRPVRSRYAVPLATVRGVAYLQYFTPAEQRLMRNGHISVAAGAAQKPGSEELRRAFLRAFADAGGRWIDPNTVTYGMYFMFGRFDYLVHVSSVRVEAMSQAPPYDIRLRVRIALEMSPEMKSYFRDSPQGAILKTLLAAVSASESEPIEHVFQLTEEGWKSPDLTAQIMAQNFSWMGGIGG